MGEGGLSLINPLVKPYQGLIRNLSTHTTPPPPQTSPNPHTPATPPLPPAICPGTAPHPHSRPGSVTCFVRGGLHRGRQWDPLLGLLAVPVAGKAGGQGGAVVVLGEVVYVGNSPPTTLFQAGEILQFTQIVVLAAFCPGSS